MSRVLPLINTQGPLQPVNWPPAEGSCRPGSGFAPWVVGLSKLINPEILVTFQTFLGSENNRDLLLPKFNHAEK